MQPQNPHPLQKYPLQLPPFLSRLLLLQPPVTYSLTLLFINHLPLKHLQQTSQWIISPHDRLLREGGGVCIYVRNTKSFSVCLKYSNSICDLLIVKLHQPSLIIILMYRPPTCPITEFNDIILKTKSYIMSLPSPLPNIIMLGDFNFPNIDWSCATTRCPMAGPLVDLAGLLFLAQQVNEPTRKHNILDLIFFAAESKN